jgi:hypothetical protein
MTVKPRKLEMAVHQARKIPALKQVWVERNHQRKRRRNDAKRKAVRVHIGFCSTCL